MKDLRTDQQKAADEYTRFDWGFDGDDLKRQLLGVDVPVVDVPLPGIQARIDEPQDAPDPDAHLPLEERRKRHFDRQYKEMMEGYEREHYL
jgi:hypothetical protein